MRTKLFIVVFLITGFISNSLGQDTISISFTAKYEEVHIPLDSILVMNLTQGTKTVLFKPDTVLMVEFIPFGTIINHHAHSTEDFLVSQNYPNPFSDQTSIDVSIAEADNIVIRIFDLSGREHELYEGYLETGKHTFSFHPGNESFYIFAVFYRGMTQSIKIVNPAPSSSGCLVSYKGFDEKPSNIKLHTVDYFQIYENDNLRYIGYTLSPTWVLLSGVIEEIPENQNNTHEFTIQEGIPCVSLPLIEYEGVTYSTVQIGTQCWFRENLRVGTLVPGITEMSDNDTLEKYCYGNHLPACEIYGAFYQWNEAMNWSTEPGARGICPPGWHIPTDEEWKVLEGTVDSHYDYPDPIWDSVGYRGYDIGKRLKDLSSWATGVSTNYVGFSALGTGCRFIDGTFVNVNYYTSFWSSDQYGGGFTWYRHLERFTPQMSRTTAPKTMGRSVRCLRNQ